MKNLLPCVLLSLVCISLSIRAGAQEINYQHVVVDAKYPKRVHCKTVGDINGDGKLDIVTRMGETHVFLQKTPDSWKRIAIPTGGRGGTALADLDGDRDLDIAQNGYWLECPVDMVNVAWPRHEIASGWPDDCGVAVADMNKDGRLDIITKPYTWDTPRVDVWLNQASRNPVQ